MKLYFGRRKKHYETVFCKKKKIMRLFCEKKIIMRLYSMREKNITKLFYIRRE